MKKQFIKYITIVMGVAFISAGCKKALDLKPLDKVSDASFYASATDFQLAANNLYSSLRTFSQGNGDGHNGTDLGADRGVLPGAQTQPHHLTPIMPVRIKAYATSTLYWIKQKPMPDHLK